MLVALAFVPNLTGGRRVDYLDGDKTNCRVDNLVWAVKRKTGVHNRPVVQYSLNWDKIAEYGSIADASWASGADAGAIGACCKKSGAYKTVAGFIWRYADDKDPRSELSGKSVVNTYTVEIRQYTLEGKLFNVYTSVKEAVERSGVRSTGIMDCCSRKFKTAGGYIWRRSFSDEFAKQNGLEETVPVTVRQYTLDFEFVAEYRTMAMAARVTGCQSGSISKCCRRAPGYNVVAGHIWRYSVDDEFEAVGRNADAIKEFRRSLQTQPKKVEKPQCRVRSGKPVRQYTMDGVFVAEYPSVSVVAEKYGVSDGAVYACCTGKTSSFKGHIWRRSSNDEYENVGDNARLLAEFRKKMCQEC